MPQQISDLIVVGAGLAGLVAATRALELGRSAIVVEARPEHRYPCNSRYSGGVFHVAFTSAMAGADAVARAIRAEGTGWSDPAQVDTMANNAGRAIEWLADHGAEFGSGGAAPFMDRMLQPLSLREAGLANHWPDKGADRLLQDLATRIVENGGLFLRGVRARSLTIRDGRCRGIEAEDAAGEPLSFACGAVLIADGGFSGNPDLVRRYISADPGALCTRGAGTGMGDGLTMAEAVGARIVGTDRFYGHVQSAEARTDDRLWPYPILDIVASSAIAVDGSGRRFVDEGTGGVPITNAIARLARPGESYVIFDQAIWEGPGRDFLLPPNPAMEERGVDIVRAATVAELAERIGMDATILACTVADYNAAIAQGDEDRLDPPRTRVSHLLAAPPYPISTPPYMAIRMAAGITYTMGGIAIDGSARVLDTDMRIIPGLFAAGAATGGLEGGPRSTYVGGLMKALVFGLVGAETAAIDIAVTVPAG